MINTNSKMNLVFLILLAFLLIWSANHLNKKYSKPPIILAMQDRAINFSNSFYRIIHLGNKRTITSILWIKTLLDGDTEHYRQKDLNSWMYLRFKSILDLDPLFLEAYRFGVLYLAVIKDDVLGAKEILDRGLVHYPDDFILNFNGGYLYLFELGENSRAIELFSKIQFDPKAPPYLPSLVARLKASQGDLESAYTLLSLAIEEIKDPRVIGRFKESLYAIRAEIDLNCLNEKSNTKTKVCRTVDHEGENYILNKEGLYQAKKTWIPFRSKEKKRGRP